MIHVFKNGPIVYDDTILTEEQKLQSVGVEELPIPELRSGYSPVLRVDVENQLLSYDYIPNPEVDTLKELLNDALALLNEGGGL